MGKNSLKVVPCSFSRTQRLQVISFVVTGAENISSPIPPAWSALDTFISCFANVIAESRELSKEATGAFESVLSPMLKTSIVPSPRKKVGMSRRQRNIGCKCSNRKLECQYEYLSQRIS